MKRVLVGAAALALSASTVHAQVAATKPLAFEVADVHVSPHKKLAFVDGGALRGGRYSLRQATMLDLIAAAYGLDASNIQGGPSWLEMDRFDITATAPVATKPDELKAMLQTLLVQRFNLKTHIGTKPMPAYILTAPKSKLKESEEAGGTSGCAPEMPAGPPAPGTYPPIVVNCKNMTMAEFADSIHQMAGGYLTEQVVDQTGLKGTYDLQLRWTGKGNLARAGADGISVFDAVDKQLGLKLELLTAPRPVLVVDSVSEKPTPNIAGIEKLLPPPPAPQFEVAVIKPSQPEDQTALDVKPTQVIGHGLPLGLLIPLVWDMNPNDDEAIANPPKWLKTARFDLLAKVAPPPSGTGGSKLMPIDRDDLFAMLRALIEERFQMKSHMEDRPVDAYTLTAPNPKLKTADPTSRTRCTEGPGPDGKDPRIASPILNRLVSCQNMTMAQIGQEFQNIASGYIYNPVLDKTGLTGSYDFTLSFSSADNTIKAPTPAAANGANGSATAASDPNGALSFFDAVNKQLGLKLEKQKRPLPVLVIDHINEVPTEN